MKYETIFINTLATTLFYNTCKGDLSLVRKLFLLNNSKLREIGIGDTYSANSLWKTIALLGISSSPKHFKSGPSRSAVGRLGQMSGNVNLLVQWKTFVMWFRECLTLDTGLLIFPTPMLGKYTSILTLSSSSIFSVEWTHVTNLISSSTQRRGYLFRHLAKHSLQWQKRLCIFPDVITHHATVSNLCKKPIFILGLIPLSYRGYKVTYPVYVLELSFTVQFIFINLLRHLQSITI